MLTESELEETLTEREEEETLSELLVILMLRLWDEEETEMLIELEDLVWEIETDWELEDLVML